MVITDDLKPYVRSIPDFPKQGIIFRDITTLLQDRHAFAAAIDRLAAHYKSKNIQKVAAIESRGFIFGGVLAYRLRTGFVPIRKPKKLPALTLRKEYKLEYGTDGLEMHVDALNHGERVVVVDDLLATGGTAAAACELVTELGGNIVGLAFLIELNFLHGREKLRQYEILSLIKYETE